MFKRIQVVTGLYGGQVNNMQTASTHTVPYDKYKLNPCFKWAKTVQKISFQLSADTGKNKAKSFYSYFYNIQVNLISTHILAQAHFSKKIWHISAHNLRTFLCPRSGWQSVSFKSNHAVHCYICKWYVFVTKVSSEISVFSIGCKTAGQSIPSCARIWGSVVTFRSQKGVREQTSLGNGGLAIQQKLLWNYYWKDICLYV